MTRSRCCPQMWWNEGVSFRRALQSLDSLAAFSHHVLRISSNPAVRAWGFRKIKLFYKFDGFADKWLKTDDEGLTPQGPCVLYTFDSECCWSSSGFHPGVNLDWSATVTCPLIGPLKDIIWTTGGSRGPKDSFVFESIFVYFFKFMWFKYYNHAIR